MPTNPEVDAWFDRYDKPQKALVLATRAICLAADPRVSECIKWQAPTFTYKGNIASFFPRAKKHVSLMVHQGGLIPGAHPVLEGDGPEGKAVKIASLADLQAKTPGLQALIRAWCDWKDGVLG